MGYAGYVPAKIAQFEFTPLEQARAAALAPCTLSSLSARALRRTALRGA
jgi:hypothetical protein